MPLFRRKSKVLPTVVGLYGKHPTASDFLRHNATSAQLKQFDQWLANALSAGERLFDDAWGDLFDAGDIAYFLFHDAATQPDRCSIGAMAPSSDKIGRRFPLILFCELDRSLLIGDYPALPQLAFIRNAGRILESRDQLTKDSLYEAPQKLQPPASADIGTARDYHQRLLDTTCAGPALAAMFEDASITRQERGLGTLRDVCRTVTPGQRPPKFGIRCPNANDAQYAGMWLSLLQHMTPGRMLPSAVWTRQNTLMYYAKPGKQALAALWNISWQDDTLCDLKTAEGGRYTPPAGEQPLSALIGS